MAIELIWLTVIAAAVVILVIGALIIKKTVMSVSHGNSSKSNIDAIIGEKCVVTEKIDNFAGCGQAKIKGQMWSARGLFDDDVFEVGEVLQIVAIEGVRVVCKKNG